MRITDLEIIAAIKETRESRVEMVVAGVDDYAYHRGYIRALDEAVAMIVELRKKKEADEL